MKLLQKFDTTLFFETQCIKAIDRVLSFILFLTQMSELIMDNFFPNIFSTGQYAPGHLSLPICITAS